MYCMYMIYHHTYELKEICFAQHCILSVVIKGELRITFDRFAISRNQKSKKSIVNLPPITFNRPCHPIKHHNDIFKTISLQISFIFSM